jgi:transcriptional regulator with XRE-family HTH domain
MTARRRKGYSWAFRPAPELAMKIDSKRLRDERIRRAWSQEHLAEVSGLGLRTVQRIENGRNASLESVSALSSVLTIPVNELVRTEKSTPSFAERIAMKRIPLIAVAYVITMLWSPPEVTVAQMTLLSLLAIEVYLAIARRKKVPG